ncbi:ABC-type transporter ATP-binding protein EcsA [Bacteroidales bacterium Barb6]|nr:ABC-type transporter ATP-binding protein EcsA [Bacteroidales bacterium Barb6]
MKKQKKSIKIHRTHKFAERDMQEYQKLTKQPILFVRHLTKKYFGKSQPAVNDISFDVYPGEFHAFIGANGAGKTTTIKSLIGAYVNWKGTVLINGIKNVKEDAKKKLGYIPETARFPDKFSALQYLIWMVMLSGLNAHDAKKYSVAKLKEMHM